MAFGSSVEMNHNEIIEALGAKAKADGDQFTLKVFRRNSFGSPQTAVATFDNAQATHFHNPETWLPRLAGGGPTFVLHAHHVKEPLKMVGGPILFSCPVSPESPAKTAIDVTLPLQPGWNGPTEMSYPTKETGVTFDRAAYSAPPPGLPGTASQNLGTSNQDGGAPKTQEAYVQWQMQQQLTAEKDRLSEKTRALEEERRRLEIENIRRESDAKLKALENTITHAQPKTDIAQIIAVITAAATPIVTAILQSNSETRKEMERARAEQTQQTQALLNQLLTRPMVDPTVLAILDKKNSEPPNQMLHQVTESMGNVMQVAMDALRTAAELQGGNQPEESGTVKTLREISKMVGSLTAGFQASAIQQRATQQPRPPPVQRPALPQPPAPQVVQQATQVTHFPKPNGNSAEVVQTPAPEIQAKPEEKTEEKRPEVEEEEVGFVEYLKDLILAHHNPLEVAKEILDNLGDEELQVELASVDGSFNDLIVKHFGEWISEDGRNLAYLQLLMGELNRQGAQLGLLNAEAAEAAEAAQAEESEEEQAGA